VVGKNDHNISEIIRNLIDLGTERHLDLFLDSEIKERESGKIYIFSTREQPNFLKIGFNTRSVVERVDEINSASGVVIPFGVRAVWSVKDAHRIEKIIHDKLSEYRVRKDREFFEMEYRDAFRSINRILKEERIEEL
jgi:hypothetical protein